MNTKRKYLIGGTAAIALTAAALLATTAVVGANAALPAQPDYVVAESVTATVTELEAQAAAEAAAAEAAAAEAAAAEAAAAQSPTNDYGIAGSAYTGAYYDPAYEATRQCIVAKESGGNYGIVSSNGMYHGAYQFSQGTSDAAAQKMGRPDLVGVPASQWTRAEQDEAFWVTWNHGAGSGNWPTAAGC